jgi:hypothetical protein
MQTLDHAEWTRRYRILKGASERIRAAKRARACVILKTVGMSDGASLDMCCIHNCAISTIGKGWGHDEPGDHYARVRRRACRQALALLDDWSADRVVETWDRRVRGY